MASKPAPAEVPECPARNAIRAISTIRLALQPARISNSMKRAGVISDRGWSREFDDPIVLPEGEKLRTRATRRHTLLAFQRKKPRWRNGRPRSRRSYSLPILAAQRCSLALV